MCQHRKNTNLSRLHPTLAAIRFSHHFMGRTTPRCCLPRFHRLHHLPTDLVFQLTQDVKHRGGNAYFTRKGKGRGKGNPKGKGKGKDKGKDRSLVTPTCTSAKLKPSNSLIHQRAATTPYLDSDNRSIVSNKSNRSRHSSSTHMAIYTTTTPTTDLTCPTTETNVASC